MRTMILCLLLALSACGGGTADDNSDTGPVKTIQPVNPSASAAR
jgi:hypothetical protein